MKRKLLPFLMVVLVAIMGSCVGDDIDDLQGQIDNLNDKITELEQSQQAALLAAIADLQASITALQADVEAGDSELADQYAALLNSLTLLEDEVANNASAVYYGNLLTDEDFSAFQTQEATIVTGKVIATSQAHIDALSMLKMVGGNLTITGGTTVSLEALQNVGEGLFVTELMEEGVSVNLPALASIGAAFEVVNNPALTAVNADALILINGGLKSMGNPMMTSLSFMALDQVASIYINEEWIGNPDYTGRGSLVEAKLSSTNVLGDVEIMYVLGGALELGTLGGNVSLAFNDITSLAINSEVIEGDFILQYCGALSTIDFSKIKTIEGGLNISFNSTGWYDWANEIGLEELPDFPVLESIGGDVRVEGNSKLTSLEGFNTVTEFSGAQIYISSNGGTSSTGLTYIDVFNALEKGGPSNWIMLDVYVWEQTDWFNGFNKLLEANVITLQVQGIWDENWVNGPIKIDGFEVMTACKSLELNAQNASEFSAFAALDNFKGWGVSNCMKLTMPDDNTVGLCSMETILNKILAGDFDSKPAIFRQGWNDITKEEAVPVLLAPCNPV